MDHSSGKDPKLQAVRDKLASVDQRLADVYSSLLSDDVKSAVTFAKIALKNEDAASLYLKVRDEHPEWASGFLNLLVRSSDPNLAKAYYSLKKIREREDLKVRSNSYLKEYFIGSDGNPREIQPRYYQVQMILHLMSMTNFVVGDDTGLGKCQPFDSLVLTDQGLLQMGEIADWSSMEPDSFRTLGREINVLVDGESLPIHKFYYGGVKPTITATTRYGFKNTGSRVHPMLVLRDGQHQWVQAQDLSKGDFLCIERREMQFPEQEPPIPHGPTAMTPEFARFTARPCQMNAALLRGLPTYSQ